MSDGVRHEVVRFTAAAVTPERGLVLAGQGIPSGVTVSERITRLVDTAYQRWVELAEPLAVYQQVARESFAEVLAGEGDNHCETPIGDIAGDAERLALFAVTLGQPLCDEIRRLFSTNEPALGCMLDSVASVAADLLATRLAEHWWGAIGKSGASTGTWALPYSPGYCGWHITGQRRLFSALKPEEIGITLTTSCLMQPLKSVSGVLLAAAGEVHRRGLGPFAFCTDCKNQTCRDRVGVDSELAQGG